MALVIGKLILVIVGSLFHFCEELELLSRDYSNDEGGDGSVAMGPQMDIDIEHPYYLIQKGVAQSALHRIPLPQPDWDHALPALFWSHNSAIRMGNRQNVQVAIMCSNIDRSDLPTKEELMRDPNKRKELESKILCMTSNVKDSDAFWQKQGQDLHGTERDLQDPLPHRERAPINAFLFQTRASPYHSHPSIHSLFPNYERVSKLSDIEFFKARLINTLEYPSIIQWAGSFINEIDTIITAPILYDSSIYIVRAEWGSNSTRTITDYCLVKK